MNIQLSTHDWLDTPAHIRAELRKIFGVPKSEGAVVVDNQVKSDGTTYKDLAQITSEKMHAFLEREGEVVEEFHKLFEDTLAKVKEILTPVIAELPAIDPKQFVIDEWVATLARIKAQAEEKSMGDYLDSVLKRIFDIKPTLIQTPNVEKPTKRAPGRPKKAK